MAMSAVSKRAISSGISLSSMRRIRRDLVRVNLLRQNSEQADQWQRRTHELTEQGQVTDRYTKAIEQIGSDKLDVRIGGIYALERIARDSVRDHPTVMEVLSAFIREHSHKPWPEPDPASREQELSTRPDVQAAVTVIGRRDKERDIGRIDLTGARLTGANLFEADLSRANLFEADLTRAIIARAKLTGAYLARANLTRATLHNADLIKANLAGADLTQADLPGADLTEAYLAVANLSSTDLTDAKFTDANLKQATLTQAVLDQANLTRANLTDANLTAATLTDAHLANANLTAATLHDATFTGADLTRANLTQATLASATFTNANLTGALWWVSAAPPPDGWELDIGSGGLKRANSGTEVPEAN